VVVFLAPRFPISESVVNTFTQDVSRLVDLCRQCICFDNVRDLTDCLKIIAADQTVRLVRIKNRLDLLYDEGQSGGYRDLALNLSMATEWNCSLGLERHVCELQLILKSFAEVKVIISESCCCFAYCYTLCILFSDQLLEDFKKGYYLQIVVTSHFVVNSACQ
jgi:hypothetical protein